MANVRANRIARGELDPDDVVDQLQGRVIEGTCKRSEPQRTATGGHAVALAAVTAATKLPAVDSRVENQAAYLRQMQAYGALTSEEADRKIAALAHQGSVR